MTREEATKIIKDYEVNGCGYCHQGGDEVEEAFKMAIEALEQEPTTKENLVVGDCISRAELIGKTIKRNSIWLKITDSRGMNLQEIIDELPSIQPTAKENLVVEDCISRAELLKAVDTWDRFGCDAGSSKLVPIKDCYVPYIHYDDVVRAIKGMPSVQPKTELETWEGIHAQVTASKGIFDKIWNEAEDNDEI